MMDKEIELDKEERGSASLQESSPATGPMIFIYNMHECDPKKCTAVRLGRMGLARVVNDPRRLPRGSVLLYPFAEKLVGPGERGIMTSRGVSAIDCSWNRIEAFPGAARFAARRLPFLLAANPVNYAIPYKLSTLEAIAGCLYIAGFMEAALRLLSTVKWGDTFLTLNKEPLSLYSSAHDLDEVVQISNGYRNQYNL
jgi:pre-rRNA-processing protein TSR3